MAQNFIVSSLDKIPNHTIIETMGIIFTGIYTSSQSFDDGVNNLKSQAQSKGCNAIINFKWTCFGASNYINTFMAGDAVKIVKTKDEKELNEKGVKKESIEIIIEKSKCSREQAIKALKECNGDITEALLAIDLNNKQ